MFNKILNAKKHQSSVFLDYISKRKEEDEDFKNQLNKLSENKYKKPYDQLSRNESRRINKIISRNE